MLTHDDRTMSIRAWARATGIHESTIRARLKAGSPVHEALEQSVPGCELLTHKGVTRPLAAWARIVGLEQNTLRARIRAGWKPGRALYQPARARAR